LDLIDNGVNGARSDSLNCCPKATESYQPSTEPIKFTDNLINSAEEFRAISYRRFVIAGSAIARAFEAQNKTLNIDFLPQQRRHN
jgi:hypothetical protein